MSDAMKSSSALRFDAADCIERDEQTLTREAEALERALGEVSGVRHAAVFVREIPQPPRRLHLWDALSEQGAPVVEDAAHAERAESALDVPATSLAARPLSLVDGPARAEDRALPRTLPESLERAARSERAGTIVHLGEGTSAETQTLAALRDEAMRIAAGLRAAGLVPGTQVVTQLEGSRTLLPMFWGCVWGGFVPVIVPVPARYERGSSDFERLVGVLVLLEPAVVVARTRSCDRLRAAGLGIEPARVLAFESLAATAPDGVAPPCTASDVAIMVLSSGSTGGAKCIQLSHDNLLARARGASALCDASADDVVLNWLPFDHIGSISDWHVRCVELGCTMVYCEKERVLGDPLEWLRLIERHRVTGSWAPNFAYARINAAVARTSGERWDLSSLRVLLTAGEAVSSGTVAELVTRLAPHGLAAEAVCPAFGMAEVGSGVTYARPRRGHTQVARTVDRSSLRGPLIEVAPDHPRAIAFSSLGPAIAGMALRIVDEHGALLPELTIGRLQLAGAALSPGYYRNADANGAFLGDGWFETGDQGFIADGELYLTGRSKDCIIVRGANYFPAEIEQKVEEVPGVELSYTAAYTVRRGDGPEQLALFVCPVRADDAALATLLPQIQLRLAQTLGLTPDYVIPLETREIPKTAIGKVQRRELARRFESGAFDAALRRADLALANERTVPGWLYRSTYRAEPLTNAQRARGADVRVVLCDRQGLGAALARTQPGTLCVAPDQSCSRTALTTLLRELAYGPGMRLEVIDVRGFGDAPATFSPDVFEGPLRARLEASIALLGALSDLRASFGALRLVTVDSHARRVIASDTTCAVRTLAPVLARVAALEVPGLETCHVDVPAAADHDALAKVAAQLADELAAPQLAREVAYRGDVRHVPALTPVEPDTTQRDTPLRRGAHVLVTGGLGDLGRALVAELSRAYDARILIVGRTPLEGDDPASARARAQLAELTARGEVHYAAVDVCAEDALERAVHEAEQRWGAPLDGSFHLAGSYEERMLCDSDWPSLRAGMAAKALGALCLERVLARRDDAFAVYVSSAASLLPLASAPGYALANGLLDALATQGDARPRYALGFSAWDGLGMSARGVHVEALRARGLLPIGVRDGLSSLRVALSGPSGQVLIGLYEGAPAIAALCGEPARTVRLGLAAYYTAEGAREPDGLAALRLSTERLGSLTRLDDVPLRADGALDRTALARQIDGSAAARAPETATEQLLARLWSELLGCTVESVGDDFFMLGGHSLLAAELLHRINATCHTHLPLAVLFEASTLAAQAKLLDEGHETSGTSVIPLASGEGTPLYCLCGINVYQALARELAGTCAVYGVLLPVEEQLLADGARVPLRVEDMAREYVAALRARDPIGPYRVLGLSFGAVIAYEVAQQLTREGAQVELLMLDFVLREGRRRSLRAQLKRGADVLRGRALRALAGQVRARVTRLLGSEADASTTAPAREVQRMDAYRRAFHSYEPTLTPYAGPALVVRALDQRSWEGYHVAADCGWSTYVRGGLTVRDVPGDHLSILQTPNVATLAAAVRGHLAPHTNTARGTSETVRIPRPAPC